jgi:hypothetical protein
MPASRLTQQATAERRAQVLKSKVAGMSWEQIARTVPGVKDAKAAAQDFRRALADQQLLRSVSGEDAAGALELERMRLDSASMAVEGVLRTAAQDPSAHDRVLRAAGRLAQISQIRIDSLGLGQVKAAPAGEDDLAARRRRVTARRQGLG